MTFTFVTAYILTDVSRLEEYFIYFKKLLETKFNFILFLDRKLENKINEFNNNTNLKIIIFDWDDLFLNKYIKDNNLKLNVPSKLNKFQSLNWLIIMSSKTYFLKLALEHTNSDLLIWIDFGGIKQTNDVEHFIKNFSKLKKYDKILMPTGTEPLRYLDNNKLFINIYWRFLGTFFICPRNLVTILDDEQNKEIFNLFKENKITWEVNYWANIEYKNPNLIKNYFSTHNSKTIYGLYDKKIINIQFTKINSIKMNNISDGYCINFIGNSIDEKNKLITNCKNLHFYNYGTKLYIDEKKDIKKAFLNAKDLCDYLGWDLESTYALILDENKDVINNKNFDKEILTEKYYKIYDPYFNSKSLLFNLIRLDCEIDDIKINDIIELNKNMIYIKENIE